ncbi:hypothetical protein PTW37_14585 [Arthrobacter agilis]|uniref:hypothetical protein n=1 Tax=Arthrobacter agilis TaxID=37921 RepID=UPI0023664221|nr:hypothetical protein [Arthrobacter agilis]WDF33058.1 hypothetical protein PTW37_14585 [Arthrobacter agilis]
MTAQRPPAMVRTDDAGLPRTTLLVMPGGQNARGMGALAESLAHETDGLLETLEVTIARLALAHRSCVLDPEDQTMDDDAFAWVQQCLEDISATLRGLSLGRADLTAFEAEVPVRALTGLA